MDTGDKTIISGIVIVWIIAGLISIATPILIVWALIKYIF